MTRTKDNYVYVSAFGSTFQHPHPVCGQFAPSRNLIRKKEKTKKNMSHAQFDFFLKAE